MGFWFGLGFFVFLGTFWVLLDLFWNSLVFLAGDDAGVDSQPCSSDSTGFQASESCSLSPPDWYARPELPQCIAGGSPDDLCTL